MQKIVSLKKKHPVRKSTLFRTGYLVSSYVKELTYIFIIYQKEYYNQLIIKPLLFFKGIL